METKLFQKCIHCNGTGLEQTGTFNTAFPKCTVCGGAKIISSVTGLPPIYGISPPSEVSEQKEVNDDVIKFLCGEGPLKGTWFHDDQRPEGEKGRYWWRKYLREYASQFTRPSVVTQSEKGETAEDLFCKIYSAEYGEKVNSIYQIKIDTFDGLELLTLCQKYSLLERVRTIDECVEAATEGRTVRTDLIKTLEKLKSRQ